MKVAVLPFFWATFFTAYLYIRVWSAILVRVLNRMPISAWPAVATSWWCSSILMPMSIMVPTISFRMSVWVSVGATGK